MLEGKNIKFEHITRATLVALIGLLYTPSVQAQGIIPCSGIPNGAPNADPCTVQDFFQLFSNIYNTLLGFAAIVAVLIVVVSGVRMLVYFWSEQPEADLENAKLTLRRGIFGLVIIIAAYLVVNTVLFVLGAGDITTFFGAIGG